MGFANFFNRSAQSLQQILHADKGSLEKILTSKKIAISFDEKAMELPNTPIVLRFLVNLMSRLYSNFGIIINGANSKCQDMQNELIIIAKSINPQIELNEPDCEFDIVISIGNSSLKAKKICFVTADSWNLEIAIDQQVRLEGKVFNPFSASVVACLAASYIFRDIFTNYVQQTKPLESFTLSLLDYEKKSTPLREFPVVNFNDLVFVGIGAIGNATIWALKQIPLLSGSISLIDPETIELSNLQRYVLTDQNSFDLYKVDLAETYLARDGLCINKYKMDFGDYIRKERPNCDFNNIAVAVDNIETRMAAQAVLPHIVFNAWTREGGNLGVSHHFFDSTQACLSCMYLANNKKKSRAEQIAEITGLEPLKVVDMNVNGIKLTDEMLQEISKNKGYPLETLMRWKGHSLNDFYTEAVCGGVLLNMQVNEPEVLVPLAHQSALAGVLLACEIVKNEIGLVSPDNPVITCLNAINPLPDYINERRGKSANCICLDEDYLEVYRKKFSLGETN